MKMGEEGRFVGADCEFCRCGCGAIAVHRRAVKDCRRGLGREEMFALSKLSKLSTRSGLSLSLSGTAGSDPKAMASWTDSVRFTPRLWSHSGLG